VHSLPHFDVVVAATHRWNGSSLMIQRRMARLRSRHRLQLTSWLCLMDVDKLSTDSCQTALRSVWQFIVIISCLQVSLVLW